jgi:hypothetical protein
MPEPVFVKLGMYIMAPEHISMAYSINLSHQSVSVSVYPRSLLDNGSMSTLPRQRIHATIEELQGASFLCCPCLIKGGSVGLSVYPLIVARQRLGTHVPVATKNCWRRRFQWAHVVSKKLGDKYLP